MTLGAPCPTSEPAPCGEVLSPQDLGGGSDTPFSGCQTVCNETWQSQLGALKQPVDIQMVAYRFPRVSPPATHTPDAGSPAQTPQLQGVGVQTPVCTWGCETAPSHSPPLPPSPACITWSRSRLGRRPEGPGRRGPQGLSPQVRKKVIARAPLCSQGRDGSEVQPTPLKPRPPWSRTGALSASQMCTHLPASRFTQPHLCGPASTCIVHWCLSGGARRRGPQTSTVPGPRSSRAGPLAQATLGARSLYGSPLPTVLVGGEAGPWNPMTRSPEAWDQQLSPEAGVHVGRRRHSILSSEKEPLTLSMPAPPESGSLHAALGPPGLQPHPSRTLWPCPASLWTLSFDFSSEVCGPG